MSKLALLFLLLPICLSGQKMGFDDIDGRNLKPWLVKDKKAYQMAYHFGDSEAESNLLLLVDAGKCYAQISWGEWTDNGAKWLKRFETLSNVRIEGNRFFSSKTNGEFVLYIDKGDTTRCLKVYQPWSGVTAKGQYEVGFVAGKAELFVDGQFPQASLRQLNAAELAKMPKADLQLMRNEIYARYGYIFKAGGDHAHPLQQTGLVPGPIRRREQIPDRTGTQQLTIDPAGRKPIGIVYFEKKVAQHLRIMVGRITFASLLEKTLSETGFRPMV